MFPPPRLQAEHPDLCAGIPYMPIVEYRGERWIMIGMVDNRPILAGMNDQAGEHHRVPYCEEVKPYLRSWRKVSTEEKYEYKLLQDTTMFRGSEPLEVAMIGLLDYFYSHHIDVQELIKKGLALEAPKGKYDKCE